jgi:hypothetical protein
VIKRRRERRAYSGKDRGMNKMSKRVRTGFRVKED